MKTYNDILMQKVIERNNKPKTNKYTRHKEITDYMHKTYMSKNKDYGNSFERTHKEIGSKASLGRIADKFYRLQNIILNDEQHVEDETVVDTLIDMANYAIMFAMELEKSDVEQALDDIKSGDVKIYQDAEEYLRELEEEE